jgi:hypothetical protein
MKDRVRSASSMKAAGTDRHSPAPATVSPRTLGHTSRNRALSRRTVVWPRLLA